jgi:hypothetical protein
MVGDNAVVECVGEDDFHFVGWFVSGFISFDVVTVSFGYTIARSIFNFFLQAGFFLTIPDKKK